MALTRRYGALHDRTHGTFSFGFDGCLCLFTFRGGVAAAWCLGPLRAPQNGAVRRLVQEQLRRNELRMALAYAQVTSLALDLDGSPLPPRRARRGWRQRPDTVTQPTARVRHVNRGSRRGRMSLIRSPIDCRF